ncbi:alpha/beta hydrolase [Rhizohabitans arisaemae]|uniref:alpha/beta hydrolase n=1 Tax=Rhizohabitans arisaemae TaxID=2720610 RepID=UPI0024B07F2E|nr:alpha/beta hydrolase [Rhizohabitans arisaemae]
MRLLRTMLVGLMLAAAAPPAVATAAAADGRHECATATSRCIGTLTVPLNWQDPQSEKITVRFGYVPRANRSRQARTSILVMPGGPSPLGPGGERVDSFRQVLQPLLDDSDMTIVEFRGTGQSAPLRCEGLRPAKPETVSQCARDLGDRAQFFSSDQYVADVEAVRAALGLPKVTVVGSSWGALTGQAYTTRYPDRVRALYIESMIGPLDEDGRWQLGAGDGRPIREVIAGYARACRRSSACRGAAGGDPEERWDAVVRKMRAAGDGALTPRRLFEALQAISDPVVATDATAAAAAYLVGDPVPLRRLLDRAAPPAPPPGPTPERAGTTAYLCSDPSWPYGRTDDEATRRRQLDDLHAGGNRYAPFTRAEVWPSGPDYCAGWPTPRENNPFGPHRPAVPMLAVAGEFDPMAVVGARSAARLFPRGQAVTVLAGYHNPGVVGRGPGGECARRIMHRFIENPGPVSGTSCAMANYQAHGRFPATVAAVPAARGGGLGAPQRTLVAAAFATVADAVAVYNPHRALRPGTEAGLRGGRLTNGGDGTITLDQVRYVTDLAATGTAKVTGGKATADLTVTGPDGATHKVTLQWAAFTATATTPVTGTLNGRPFRLRVPGH